jgi:hypothetical protein
MGGANSDPGDGARDTGGRSPDAGPVAGEQTTFPVSPDAVPSPASASSPASRPPAREHSGEASVAGSPPSPAGSADSTGDVGTADKTRPVDVVAPPWTGWVYYLVGGTLPPTYSAWVSHDLTAPGWRRRQAARTGLLLLPVACVFALLPGPVAIRMTIVVFIAVTALGLGFGAAGYFRNRRLLQHGFPPVFPKSDGNGNGGS